ncbi:MAG: NADH:flavin oxidoreductase/NADH oxidase [Rubrimonas sp.]
MSALFSPFALKDARLRNRVAAPPMCQYSARDGFATDWHEPHYASIARGGAGLVIVEATAVSPEGRITPGCLGLWDDAQTEGLARVAAAIRAAGAVPGIQIGHAGRKASANRPWEGDDHIADDAGGWPTVAPSALAASAALWKTPRAMQGEDIARVQADFAAAARRAVEAGFEWLELHFAHGYLAQSFFSALSNRREDRWGGDAAGRGRFLLETLAAVRAVWPERLPLTARFGVVEFDGRDAETLPEALALVRAMRDRGLDLLSVSMGFTATDAQIPWTPGFMAPVAGRVRREAGLPTATAWMMDDPVRAEAAVARGDIDIALVGRAHLENPHYAFRAARALGIEKPAASTLPPAYAYWLARYPGPQKGKPHE